MTNIYDAQIKEQEAKIHQIKLEMNDIKNEFKAMITAHTKTWFNDNARKLIVDNTETSGALQDEELRELKSKVSTLISNTENLVNEHFDKADLWWHIKENTYGYSEHMDNRIPPVLYYEVSRIYGKLGELFQDANIIKVHNEKGTTVHNGMFVAKKDGAEIRIEYNTIPTFTNDISNKMKEYGKLHKEALSAQWKINELKKEQRKNSLGELWDSL